MTDFEQIQLMHGELYDQYLDASPDALAENAYFIEQAKELVGRMAHISAEITCREDYEWLAEAAEKWRAIFVSVLNIAHDVSLNPPRTPPKPAPPPKVSYGDTELDRWIGDQAWKLAKDRALRQARAKSGTELLREKPSTPEEQVEDWLTATVLLACDVVDGRTQLTQIKPRGYPRLESCWLEDVKRLKAYFRWHLRGAPMGDPADKNDWDEVCQELQSNVLRAGPRQPIADFEPIREYLANRYVESGSLTRPKAHELIAAKALRLYEASGGDAERNWLEAEAYTRAFYGNIVQAVCDRDTGAIKQVTDALGACAEEPAAKNSEFSRWHLISNAFETAIAISFVEGAAGLQALTRAAG